VVGFTLSVNAAIASATEKYHSPVGGISNGTDLLLFKKFYCILPEHKVFPDNCCLQLQYYRVANFNFIPDGRI